MSFIGKWQHKTRFSMRVWPRGEKAIKLSLAGEKWSVDGMTFNVNERLEVVHRLDQKNFAPFELSEDDAERLMSVGASGAKLGDMWIHCPGTLDSRAKKECYLEVNVTVYPQCAEEVRPFSGGRTAIHCQECDIEKEIRRQWADADDRTYKRILKHHGKALSSKWKASHVQNEWNGYTLYSNPKILNVDVVAQNMFEGRVALFDARHFTGRMMEHLRKRLNYYVVPDRDPGEEGGLFRGYQFAGRFFLYFEETPKEEGVSKRASHVAKMNEATREKGRASRRTYFVRKVIEGIAERYGVSVQRVTTRFIEEGILDYLIRSAESVPYGVGIRPRQASQFYGAKIKEAVEIVSIIVEGLAAMEGGNGI
ncbi:MAG: hypothetical protein J6Q84_07440 [Kiritimatiellae bacterium]|nr:hypothetical protein [Kiritimatiellia bacterium]